MSVGTIGFTKNLYLVDEAGEWKGSRLAIARLNGSEGRVEARVSIRGSSLSERATSGTDYLTASQIFVWEDGEDGEKEIFFQPIEDDEEEILEYAFAYCYPPDGVESHQQRCKIFIQDVFENAGLEGQFLTAPAELILISINGGTESGFSCDYVTNKIAYFEREGLIHLWGQLHAENILHTYDPYEDRSPEYYHRVRIKLPAIASFGENIQLPVPLTLGSAQFWNFKGFNHNPTWSGNRWYNIRYATGNARMQIQPNSNLAGFEYFDNYEYLKELIVVSNEPAALNVSFSGIFPGRVP